MGEQEIEKIATIILHKSQYFEGPLPSPDVLKGYLEVLSDAPERIFKMAETAQNHQIAIETKAVNSEIDKVKRGQYFAFILAVVGIAGAVTCAFLEQTAIGALIGGTTLISLVPYFITGKHKKRENQANNQSENLDLKPEDSEDSSVNQP